MIDNEFSILTSIPQRNKKQIIVEFNFGIDEKTANRKTIKLSNSTTKTLVDYHIKVDKKHLYILLDEVNLNSTYVLEIDDIVDELNRKLNHPYKKEIVFKFDVKTIVEFIKPVNNETIKSKILDLEIKAMSVENEVISYEFDISKDIAFSNIYNTIKTDKTSISTAIKEDGQYFIRCRATIKSTIDGEEDLYGDYCNPISIIIYNSDNSCSEDNKDNDFLDDFVFSDDIFEDTIEPLQILSKTINGSNETEFYIEFNKDIDVSKIIQIHNLEESPEEDIDGIKYITLDTFIYRRDL